MHALQTGKKMLGILSLFNQQMSCLGVRTQKCIPAMIMCDLQIRENKYRVSAKTFHECF